MLFSGYSARPAIGTYIRWGIACATLMAVGTLWAHEARCNSTATTVAAPLPTKSASTPTAAPSPIRASKPSTHEQKLAAQDKVMLAGLQGQLLRESLPPSPLLAGRQGTAWVYLPPDYDKSTTRYPVAYLLHGAPGEPRDLFVNAQAHRVAEQLITQGKVAPMILVSFDAFGPKGINDVQDYLDRSDGSYSMESFFTQTLVPWVDDHFRTRTNAQSRALVGFSAGGYGAANLGAKHPELFKVVASISGFFDPNDDPKNMTRLLGPKSKLWDDNSPLQRARELPRGLRLHFYMDCGRDDSLYHEFVKMQRELQARGADYESHSLPGDHTWDYVHSRLFAALQFCDQRWKSMS